MKKLNLILVTILSVLVMTSCDEGQPGPVMNSNPDSPSINAPESGQSYTLSEDEADDTLMTMEWTEPDYGFPSAPEYNIQMDSATHDFSDPIQIATVNTTSFSITVGEMNSTMLGAGYPFGEEISLDFRVVASVSDSVEEQISDPVTLNITAYSVCQFCPEIYVPGGYQSSSGYGADWTPADAPALATINDQDQYEGYVYIENSSSEFKFTAERNWANGDWGTSGTEGELESPGNNIVAEEAGYYKMNVDLNNMSYSLLNTQWGIIGSATENGWDSDQDMTYDSDAKVWTITTDLTADEMKFRANDAWNLNYGDNNADGTLEQDGANIQVNEAGNYTVVLDLSETPYSYTITQN